MRERWEWPALVIMFLVAFCLAVSVDAPGFTWLPPSEIELIHNEGEKDPEHIREP